MKFKLIKDIIANSTFEDVLLYEKGTIFIPNEDGLFEFKGMDGNIKYQTEEDLLKRNTMFESVKEIELDIKEISPHEEDMVRNYRIQLDVKTSSKKLKEIEKVFKEVVSSILD